MDPRLRGDDNLGFKFPLEFAAHPMWCGNDSPSVEDPVVSRNTSFFEGHLYIL